MKTLEDAWRWYQATDAAVKQLTRLAGHWDQFSWDLADAGSAEIAGADQRLVDYARQIRRLRRDNELGNLQSNDMRTGADLVQVPLNDLAILILFSVFEAEARDWIADRIRPELDTLQDPTIRWAAGDALKAVEEGSFGRVLDPYKSAVGAGLVEEVNQVRRYRNWVAHGRRDDMRPKDNVEPREAYDRLTRFLAALRGGESS